MGVASPHLAEPDMILPAPIRLRASEVPLHLNLDKTAHNASDIMYPPPKTDENDSVVSEGSSEIVTDPPSRSSSGILKTKSSYADMNSYSFGRKTLKFADSVGGSLTEIKFCQNLHYSPVATSKVLDYPANTVNHPNLIHPGTSPSMMTAGDLLDGKPKDDEDIDNCSLTPSELYAHMQKHGVTDDQFYFYYYCRKMGQQNKAKKQQAAAEAARRSAMGSPGCCIIC